MLRGHHRQGPGKVRTTRSSERAHQSAHVGLYVQNKGQGETDSHEEVQATFPVQVEEDRSPQSQRTKDIQAGRSEHPHPQRSPTASQRNPKIPHGRFGADPCPLR